MQVPPLLVYFMFVSLTLVTLLFAVALVFVIEVLRRVKYFLDLVRSGTDEVGRGIEWVRDALSFASNTKHYE